MAPQGPFHTKSTTALSFYPMKKVFQDLSVIFCYRGRECPPHSEFTRRFFIVGGGKHTRERRRGGQKSRGGKTSRGDPPHGKQFPTPLTSVRFAPPYSISLSKSFRNAQNLPQLTSSETAFGGSQKVVSDGPSSRGFAFRYVLPPPLALPSHRGTQIRV